MKLKELKNKRIFKILSNRYILISIVFLIWMTFFDENSFIITSEFDNDIEKLEKDKEYYQQEISNDKAKIEKLTNEEELEKFAREKYKLKKENEDIYIIEYDTID